MGWWTQNIFHIFCYFVYFIGFNVHILQVQHSCTVLHIQVLHCKKLKILFLLCHLLKVHMNKGILDRVRNNTLYCKDMQSYKFCVVNDILRKCMIVIQQWNAIKFKSWCVELCIDHRIEFCLSQNVSFLQMEMYCQMLFLLEKCRLRSDIQPSCSTLLPCL